ncbi:hypothetical protein SAY86_021235 [Trapa natans]|uniref:Ycf20-like protein n=1 Tax=Trapa natans TaxID=22666 RepID=A0AAN7RLF4_TRANT|nr:hypothetical protein SAY86_021235 [Trapa natans]
MFMHSRLRSGSPYFTAVFDLFAVAKLFSASTTAPSHCRIFGLYRLLNSLSDGPDEQLSLTKSFKNMTWSIRSNADGSGGLDSSSMNGTDTGTRLIRMIRGIQSQLGKMIQELRKNLPVKLLCFLVGFYCATAFATVIGQTGDWDILSAALAVVVVEGIGALIYKASLPLISNIRNLIIMLNYWKAGLSMGLFLDSFKYEMDNFLDPCSLFNFDMDLLPRFL